MLHILSNMLVINVCLIINSKVFGFTIGDNLFFPIVVERFYDCKHVVEEERM